MKNKCRLAKQLCQEILDYNAELFYSPLKIILNGYTLVSRCFVLSVRQFDCCVSSRSPFLFLIVFNVRYLVCVIIHVTVVYDRSCPV